MKRTDMEARIAILYDLCKRVHGSGVDWAWEFAAHDITGGYTIINPCYPLDTVKAKVMAIKSKVLRLKNSFHCMNEHGGYSGWADFTIIFPNNKPLDEFRIVFRGPSSQRLQKRHDLKEYLYQLIHGALHDIQVQASRETSAPANPQGVDGSGATQA